MQATATLAYRPTGHGKTSTHQPGSIAVDDPPLESLPDAGEALLDVFNDVRDSLFSTLYYLLGNQADAQDAMQIAFLRCWRARTALPGLCNVRAWVWRVSLNAGRDLRDHLRRRRTEPLSAVEKTAICRQASPGEALESRERLERLRAALDHLRPEEKEVFLLRQSGTLTYDDIAQLRGCPTGTVKTQMHAALHKLRRILEEPE